MSGGEREQVHDKKGIFLMSAGSYQINSETIAGLLVKRRVVSRAQISQVLEDSNPSQPLWERLISGGLSSPGKCLPVVAEHYQTAYVNLKSIALPPELLELLTPRYAYFYRVLPLKLDKNVLTLAAAHPQNAQLKDDLRMLLGYEIETVLAYRGDIDDLLKKHYGLGADTVAAIRSETGPESWKGDGETKDIEDLSEEASVMKFVNQVLAEAYHARATDVHIEPFNGKVKLRYRIDGILREVPGPASLARLHPAIVSRVKIMSNLNISESRLPQDGRIKVKVGNTELDLRVSILPSQHGETLNIRLLNTSNVFYGLPKLGLAEADRAVLQRIIRKPHGIVLVTGPTGSGKTTTLYSCLNEINDFQKKIITIEDPVEYQLEGISQIQVFPKIELSFARGLRSMLRHDPDILMVGEIRDQETAEIAVQAALTGHLVFSTLHTNDAAGAITRLVDIGVEPYLISSTLECVLAQRLVRLICPGCRAATPLSEQERALLQGVAWKPPDELYAGKGCEKCGNSGYFGRSAIFELLVMDDDLGELILAKKPAAALKKLAVQKGMRTLLDDGLAKASLGLTTVSEVMRVTQE